MSAFASDESGAVLIIVALSMFAFLGMTMLVVDVGGLLVSRRQIVKGADSGALAAAQTCVTTGATLTAAEADADEFAVANQTSGKQASTLGGIVDSDGCGTEPQGYVTVEYEIPQDFFFAPVLGLPEGMRVPARATAIWGHAGVGNPLPIMVSEPWLEAACDLDELNLNEEIACLWDNDQLASANFGGLDLDDWNVDASQQCTGEGGAAEQKGWVNNGGIEELLQVNDSPPTWVCATQGLREDVVDELDEYVERNPNNILFLPISRPAPLMKNDNQIDKFNIVGFLAVRVLEAGKVAPSSSINGYCEAKSVGAVATDTELFLDSLIKTCSAPYQAPFSSIQVQQVKALDAQGNPSGGEKSSWTFSGTDTRVLTWTGDDLAHGLYVKFKFTQPGAANCGTQTTSNTSAYCITFKWLGPQLVPGGVIDCDPAECVGNVKAIRLSE